jgi:hypothetical protein
MPWIVFAFFSLAAMVFSYESNNIKKYRDASTQTEPTPKLELELENDHDHDSDMIIITKPKKHTKKNWLSW